jgi:2Fe-2S ferredoxin
LYNNSGRCAVAVFKVTFVQLNGVEKAIEAEAGQSLMSIARGQGVDGILGDCGGCCSCATCHVYVDPQWQAAVGGPDEVEASTLELASDVVKPNSRLSCQITLRAELDGIRVAVAPSA